VTPRDLTQRRRLLFTMLTALGFRYPPGREPPVIAGLRQWLEGWLGVGRVFARASAWHRRAAPKQEPAPLTQPQPTAHHRVGEA